MSKNLSVQDSAKLFKALESQHEDWIIARAIEITERRIFQRERCLQSPTDAGEFLRTKLTTKHNEVFVALFLDAQHRVIAYEELFKGTVDGTSVYPRVVLSRTLEHNAAAVIFAHNHPSGLTAPSAADRTLTTKLVFALSTIDVRVLDHLIIGEGQPYSFAENGLL